MTSKVQQDFIVAALIGGVVGAAAALMFAPVPGAKLRDQVSNGFGYFEDDKPRRRKPSAKKQLDKVEKAVKSKATKAGKKVKSTAAALSKKVKAPRKKKAAKAHKAHESTHAHATAAN